MQTIRLTILALLISFFLFTNVHGIASFPSAEGFGAESVGGRGGTVIKVTNTNDSGAGSLRAALETEGARIVIFEVSGTIYLQSRIDLLAAHSYLTVAGETAPGDGICIAGYPIIMGDFNSEDGFHNGIFRNLRFRLSNEEGVGKGIANCIIIYSYSHDIIFDHCSFTWAFDQVMAIFGRDIYDITFQWCIFAEGLCKFEQVGVCSNFGPFISNFYTQQGLTYNITFHHNYLAHMDYRNYFTDNGNIHFINNVNYNVFNHDFNLGQRSDDQIEVDAINNYFKEGPDTSAAKDYVFDLYKPVSGTLPVISLHVAGNYPVDINGTVRDYYNSEDNWSVVNLRTGAWAPDPTPTLRAAEHATRPTHEVTRESASAGKDLVLDYAGALYPSRDSVDTRILGDFTDQDGYDSANTEQYPTLTTGSLGTDTDSDGMPDTFEDMHGTDKNVADATGDIDSDGYNNIEEWFHYLTDDYYTVASGTMLTGLGGSNVSESNIVSGQDGAGGSLTIVVTLTGTTFAATLGADNAITTAFIQGFDSAQSETGGWNNKVRDVITHTAVVRDSDTQATVTIPATADYSITANETITNTIDNTVTVSGIDIAVTPDLTISNVSAAASTRAVTYSSDGRDVGYSGDSEIDLVLE